jgi:Cu/Zn superoxide dismutase
MKLHCLQSLLMTASLLSVASCNEQISPGQLSLYEKNIIPTGREYNPDMGPAPEPEPGPGREQFPREDSPGREYSPETEHVQKNYYATLRTLNDHVPGNKTFGQAKLTISNGMLAVEIDVEGSPADIVHIQHIHEDDQCPTAAADTNNDGYIDVAEGLPSYGPIMLNLDGDLTSNESGQEGFPVADRTGSFFYSQSAHLNEIQANLGGALQGPLDLTERTIVIHGVAQNTNLPQTVQSIGDLPNHVTLPIACGVIRVARPGGKN